MLSISDSQLGFALLTTGMYLVIDNLGLLSKFGQLLKTIKLIQYHASQQHLIKCSTYS